MNVNHPAYRSYLLRMWWDAAQHDWRVSLQSTATEQILQFATLEALLTFLLAELSDDADDNAPAPLPQPP